ARRRCDLTPIEPARYAFDGPALILLPHLLGERDEQQDRTRPADDLGLHVTPWIRECRPVAVLQAATVTAASNQAPVRVAFLCDRRRSRDTRSAKLPDRSGRRRHVKPLPARRSAHSASPAIPSLPGGHGGHPERL